MRKRGKGNEIRSHCWYLAQTCGELATSWVWIGWRQWWKLRFRRNLIMKALHARPRSLFPEVRIAHRGVIRSDFSSSPATASSQDVCPQFPLDQTHPEHICPTILPQTLISLCPITRESWLSIFQCISKPCSCLVFQGFSDPPHSPVYSHLLCN